MKNKTVKRVIKFSPIALAACSILLISAVGVSAAAIISWKVKSIDVPFAIKYTVELAEDEKKGWLGELAGSGNYVEVSIAATSYDIDKDVDGYRDRLNEDIISIEGQGGKKIFGSGGGGVPTMHEKHNGAGVDDHWYYWQDKIWEHSDHYTGGVDVPYTGEYYRIYVNGADDRNDCIFANMDGGRKSFYEGYIVEDESIGKDDDYNNKALVDVFFEAANNGDIVAIYTRFDTQYYVEAQNIGAYSFEHLTPYKRVAMADIEVVGEFNKMLMPRGWGQQYNEENPFRPYEPEGMPEPMQEATPEETFSVKPADGFEQFAGIFNNRPYIWRQIAKFYPFLDIIMPSWSNYTILLTLLRYRNFMFAPTKAAMQGRPNNARISYIAFSYTM